MGWEGFEGECAAERGVCGGAQRWVGEGDGEDADNKVVAGCCLLVKTIYDCL